jgi:adenosyl cobinamide kinase/adenosyl cobinamide phosphate guanylyltransferase
MTHASIRVTRTITQVAYVRACGSTDAEAIADIQRHMAKHGADFTWHETTGGPAYEMVIEEREHEYDAEAA